MFDFVIFTFFFEINNQLIKRHSVEHIRDCPFDFKEFAQFGKTKNDLPLFESNGRLRKKIKHKEILIAITCREDELMKGNWK